MLLFVCSTLHYYASSPSQVSARRAGKHRSISHLYYFYEEILLCVGWKFLSRTYAALVRCRQQH